MNSHHHGCLSGSGIGFLVLCIFAGLATAVEASAESAPPATKAANVPSDTIRQMRELFRRPQQRMAEEEARKYYIGKMHKVLEKGDAAEEKYPNAENIGEVREIMLEAANVLMMIDRSKKAHQRRLDIAHRLLESDVSKRLKAKGDLFVTLAKVRPYDGKIAKDSEKEIRDFVKRYKDTDAQWDAFKGALYLARSVDNYDLEVELADMIRSRYADERQILRYLKQMGLGLQIGQKFQAELNCLNGDKLTLPEDLMGNVVVVDFWATWCGPCVKEMPRMKEFYAEYMPKGVEIVGISLDRSKAALKKFVDENQLEWIQTYTRGNGTDPTAERYGVNAIPSIWVIAPDGTIVSTSARGRLEKMVAVAMMKNVEPATRPDGAETKPVDKADADDE